jgi:EAL domain-containing protein (putative c-di-GMP-specific phosphodiesterase class I)
MPQSHLQPLGPVGDLHLQAVFQPIVDLRDGSVVGFEALARGPQDLGLESPADLFAAARAQDQVTALDLACLSAALGGARAHGLASPLSLFLNAEPTTLDTAELRSTSAGHGLVVEVTERALTARPEALLRSLEGLRTRGWGVALDDVGADSRSLALMSLLYPDVIKLDMRLMQRRGDAEIATIVTAVGTESERSRAIVLAEGIDSEEQLAVARAWGATLGQGYLLGSPGRPPEEDPIGRALPLRGSGGDPWGSTPYDRVTNWKRPQLGPRALAEMVAVQLERQAASLGDTAMVLAGFPDEGHADAGVVARYRELSGRVAFVGVLGGGAGIDSDTAIRGGPLAPEDRLRGTWTVVALGPYLNAAFVARADGDGTYRFAVSYDRETVTECALMLMARMEPLQAA